MSLQSPGPAPQVLEDPDFLPLLPMLYIAWSDGEMSRDELDTIRNLAHAGEWLTPAARELALSWLNPEQPPTASQLLRLLRRIRLIAKDLPFKERTSLVEFGLALQQHASPEPGNYWNNSGHLQALSELEETLGMSGHESLFEILGQPDMQPPVPKGLGGEPEAGFSVEALRQTLDGRYRETIEQVRAMLRAPIFRFYPEDDKETQRNRVRQWLVYLADQGFGRKAYPDVLNPGGELGEFMAVFETLAHFDLSLVIKLGVQFGLFGGSIYFLGSDTQREPILPDIASAKLLGCFAMSELGHGSNVRDLLTQATFDPESDEWLIHTPTESARKEWIGGAAQDARLAVVFAQLETLGEHHGVHAFMVPLRDENHHPLRGVRIADCGHKMGLNGVDNGILWFDQVRIPRTNLLNRFASVDEDGNYTSPIASASKRFFTMLGTLVGGRVSVAAAGVSVAKSALAITIRYSAMRRQFGPNGSMETTLLDYPSHQRRLIPRLATTYALHFAIRDLVDYYTNEESSDRRIVEAMAAAIKATSTWHTTATVQECRESCGGQGFLSANRLPALKADSDVFATFEGDNVVLMQLVAKSVLTQFRSQFTDMKFLGTLRFLAEKFQNIMGEFNPISSRLTDSRYLCNPETHAQILQFRETDLTWSLASRIRDRIKRGHDPFEAFKQCQNHALALARAYGERLIHTSFWTAVQNTRNDEVRQHLQQLCQLYGLACWENDLAWFMAHNVTAPNQAKAVSKQVTQHCAQIRPQAVHLVNAFAIPDNCLAAPIAFEKHATE